MATHPHRRGWSYAEFARLPDDGNRYEVIDGELHVTPAPRPVHQDVVGRIVEMVRPHVRKHALGKLYPGPVDVLLGEGDYLQPDLAFVRRERAECVSDRGIEGPPDLVLEVVSRSTAMRDRGVKRERYAASGVPEYWIVDADARRVEVYRLQEDPDHPTVVRDRIRWTPAEGGPVLELELAELFDDLD
jgi:Uma2 family endonuclease